MKETLAEEPEKENIDINLQVTGSVITATSESFEAGDVVYASAYVQQGDTTHWLGTKVVEVQSSPLSVVWDLDGLDGEKAYFRFVTAGGQSSEEVREDLESIQSGMMTTFAAPLAIEKYNAAGQLEEDSNWIYQYNDAGQLIGKVGKGENEGTYITYSYDPEGRLMSEAHNGQLFKEFSYDGDGRKVREKVISGDQEKTIYYVYDKDERLAYQKIVITEDGKVIHEDEKSYPQREDEQ